MVEDKEQTEKAASERKIADNKKKKQKAEENKDADLSEEDLELKNNLLLTCSSWLPASVRASQECRSWRSSRWPMKYDRPPHR